MATHITPDRLFIDKNPKLLAGLLVGFLVVFWGIGISGLFDWFTMILWVGMSTAIVGSLLYSLAQRIQIILDRAENKVILRTSTLLRKTDIDFKLEHLAKAELQTMTNDKGAELGRAVLVFDDGMHEGEWPLTPHFSDKGPWADIVEGINDWLAQAAISKDANSVDSQPPQA